MTEVLTIGTRKTIECNTCRLRTNHELKYIYSSEFEKLIDENTPNEHLDYYIMDTYYLWICCGCDSATIQIDTDYNGAFTETTYYPRRGSTNHSAKYFLQLKKNLKSVYQEVVECLNAGLRLSCAMGLRALLEGICIDRGISDKEAWGLENKLDKLDEGKHLPSNIVESLHSFKFLGDNAAHRLEAPSQDELELAVDVMEDLLNYLYEREYSLATKAKKLAKKRNSEINRAKLRREKRRKQNPSTP